MEGGRGGREEGGEGGREGGWGGREGGDGGRGGREGRDVCVSFVVCGHSGMGVVWDGGASPHFSAWWGRHRKCPLPQPFLLARDLIVSQFSIDCCQNAFASGALPGPNWGLAAPPDPQLENWGHTHRSFGQLTSKMNPPFPNPGYGPERVSQ